MRTIVVLLLAGAAWAGDDFEARLAALEKRVDALDERLARIEKLMERIAKLEARGRHQALAVKEMNNMRNMIGLMVVQGKIPMKDGRVDPFSLVAKGDVEESHFFIFRSNRFETGPTKEEIKQGNYTSFPYARFKGEVKQGMLVPLLWDRKPDANDKRVVGFTGGAVKYLPEARIQDYLKKYNQVPPNPPK